MAVPNVQCKTPDDGQRKCPKHVEFRTRINLEISASVGFVTKKFVTMHDHTNLKSVNQFVDIKQRDIKQAFWKGR